MSSRRGGRPAAVPAPRPGRREELSRRPGAGRAGALTPAAPARTTTGAAVRAGSPAALRTSLRRGARPPRRGRPRPSTARLAAVAVVLGLLIISYASSVRTYLGQRAEIAGVEADIAQRQQQISSAQVRIEQWSDPAYVELAARQRYDLVLPGEHLYLVVDDPGAAKPATTVVTPSVGGAKVTVPRDSTWWSRVAGSVGAAGSSTAAPSTAAPSTAAPSTAAPSTADPAPAAPATRKRVATPNAGATPASAATPGSAARGSSPAAGR